MLIFSSWSPCFILVTCQRLSWSQPWLGISWSQRNVWKCLCWRIVQFYHGPSAAVWLVIQLKMSGSIDATIKHWYHFVFLALFLSCCIKRHLSFCRVLCRELELPWAQFLTSKVRSLLGRMVNPVNHSFMGTLGNIWLYFSAQQTSTGALTLTCYSKVWLSTSVKKC